MFSSYFKTGTDKYGNTSTVPKISKIVTHSVFALIALILVFSFWPFKGVGAGQRGVVTLFGQVQDNVLGEGLHFVNPLVSVTEIPIQTQTIAFDNGKQHGDSNESSSLFAASKDLQDVSIAVVVTYHIPEGFTKNVYQQYQGLNNYQNNILSPIVRESVKAISAQYTAEELVTKRSEVSDKMNQLISTRFTEKGAVAESAKITNFEFSSQFTTAIEAKVTAVQQAEAAKNKLVQVQYEAQQRTAQAQGEADAIKIQSQAINAQGGADYVKLQAIKQWDGKLPSYMSGSSAVPFLDINK